MANTSSWKHTAITELSIGTASLCSRETQRALVSIYWVFLLFLSLTHLGLRELTNPPSNYCAVNVIKTALQCYFSRGLQASLYGSKREYDWVSEANFSRSKTELLYGGL